MVSLNGLELLSETVGNKLQAVTYKWLAREALLPYDTAKALLFDFTTQHGSKVQATFLLGGWTSESTPRHTITLVPSDKLEKAKAGMSSITTLHIYAVAPPAQKDLAVLANLDYAQTAAMFTLTGDKIVQAQGLSAVQGPGAGPVGTAPARTAKVPAALTTKREQTVKVEAPPEKPAAVSSQWKPADSKEEVKKPEAKPSVLPQAQRAKPALPPAAPTVPKKEPQAKASAARTGRQIVDDAASSDEESDFVEPSVQAHAAGPVSTPASQQLQGSAAGSKPKTTAKTASKVSKGGKSKVSTQPLGSGAENMASVSIQSAKAVSQPPVSKGTKRVMKTYYNDAGEEVTEMVEEEADGSEPAPPVQPAKPAAPDVQPTPGPAASPQKAGTAVAPGGKRAKSGAGQRNIMSFFGAK